MKKSALRGTCTERPEEGVIYTEKLQRPCEDSQAEQDSQGGEERSEQS